MKVAADEIAFLAEQTVATTLGSGIDVEGRTIYLVGEVDDDMAYRFLVGFRTLDRSDGPIRIVMASGGGSEPAGYTIYDTIRLARNEVTIDCYGVCMSIAALILQAGAKRRMSPECRFMIHNGHVDLSAGLDAGTLVAIGQEVGRNNLRYQRLLAERAGQTVEKVTEFCEKETYLSADQAIQMGFADEVIVPDTNPPAKKKRSRRSREVEIALDFSTVEKVIKRKKRK